MIWTGAVNNSGYGTLQSKGKTMLVHRVAFELFVRALKPGERVCHECDQSLCWEPRHLTAKSQRENVRDCFRRGRGATGKLTVAQARAILAEKGKRRAAVVAAEHGIAARNVYAIWSGKHYGYLEDAA